MKIYTEEQVREMLQVCQDSDLYEYILTFDDILKTQISIELPSDEEIQKESYEEIQKEAYGFYGLESYMKVFVLGAKTMRDKLQKGKK